MPRGWMYKWIIFVIVLLLSLSVSSQDNYANPIDVLLIQLEDAMEKGNPRAIRELAGIIDKVEKKEKILRLLEEHTLFPKEQLNLDNLNREKLFEFLNEYESEIVFSPILDVFITRPIEEFTTEYEVLRKRNLTDKEKSSLLQRHVEVLGAASDIQLEVFAKYQLQEIANLQSYESYDFLLGCLEGRNLPQSLLKADFIEGNICEALTSYDDPYVLEIILEQLKKGKINAEDATRMLSRFTNIRIEEDNPKKLAKGYLSLLDSLGTLSGLRNFGFENESSIRLAFFEESVDYYAYMLSKFYDNPWMRENALREMMATGNPRSLFYLSAVLFAQHKSSALDRKMLEDQFEKYLNILILLNDGEGVIKNTKDKRKDKAFYLNQAIYWSNHYSDYEYDADRRIFINVRLEEENEESATRLFKKLTSDNDMAALESFKELSKYPPSIITKLYTKYQSILRRSNPRLPDFRYGFLENLAELHEFCEMEGIAIEASDELVLNLEELKKELSIKKRYEIENKIINSLDIKDLTFLEVEGLVFSKNIDFNFSISRILDIYYSKHLSKIVRNDLQLRLFLKKSVLFSSIGVGGISNKYFLKLEGSSRKMQSKLIKLSRKEYDEDIRDAISYVLPEDEEQPTQAIPFESFMLEPLEFGSREFHLVEAPDNKALKVIFKEVNASKNPEKILKYIEYLTLHSSEAYTPYLLTTLKNTTVLSEGTTYKRTVADAAVLLLENIYEYSFAISDDQPLRESAGKWYAFSKSNKDYKNWQSVLFNKKVDGIIQKNKILITELNLILNSDYCDKTTEEKCLSSLYKLNKHNDIRKLNIKRTLPYSYLFYFKELDFNDKYLDDVLELFDAKDANDLMEFVDEYMIGIPPKEAGKIYNNLCDLDWYIPTVIEKDKKYIDNIVGTMNAYLDESDFISEFEEKRILNRVFLLQYGNESILKQLKYTKDFIKDDEQLYNIQQNILAKVTYKELSEILEESDLLVQKKGESPYDFIEKKLGLPSYLFETEKSRKEFRKDLKGMSELEIYRKYLSISGLDIFKKEEQLDFKKVRDVLEFDIVNPFCSTVSRNRIHYATGVIQLLDTMYPKSNIDPSDFNDIRKLARTWLEYLEKTGDIDAADPSYSFNHFD